LIFSSSFVLAQQASVSVSEPTKKVTISKHIYGHFAEHLGHCIYGGIWVGKRLIFRDFQGL
jgi:alpha-N-arabinofuranosidase